MSFEIPPALYVLVAAAFAPAIGNLARGKLSVVVIELLLGVLIGPQVLGLVSASEGALPAFSALGLTFLFFLAGMEIDLPAIKGKPLTTAIAGWLVALVLAGLLAKWLESAAFVTHWQPVAIALATTALGILVPILRDSGATATRYGRYVLAVGMVGEVGPILVMSIMLARHRSATSQAGLTAAFVALVLVLAWLMARGARVPAILRPLQRGLDQSGQLPIRIVFVLVVSLAVLAHGLGLDIALGALAAGMMTAFAIQGGERLHDLHAKLDAIGYGFLIPLFFIVSGTKLDVQSIFTDMRSVALLAIAFAAIVAIHVPLALMLRRDLGTRAASSAALFAATTLSMIVVVSQVAMAADVMSPTEAAPLVGAGILSVVALPPVALALAGIARSREDSRKEREAL